MTGRRQVDIEPHPGDSVNVLVGTRKTKGGQEMLLINKKFAVVATALILGFAEAGWDGVKIIVGTLLKGFGGP